MAKSHESVHADMLASLNDRVRVERDQLRRRLAGEPQDPPARSGPRIDLAPRVRASRQGGGRLYQVFRAWAEVPPPEA